MHQLAIEEDLRSHAVQIDSLDRHIRLGWNIFSYERGEFIFTIPPQFRASEKWYQGTADAVYQNIYTIERESPDYVLILCGDHIYKMDYSELLEFHVAMGADVTVSTIEFPARAASHLGVLEMDRNQRIVGFEEKPKDPKTDAVRIRRRYSPRWGSMFSILPC